MSLNQQAPLILDLSPSIKPRSLAKRVSNNPFNKLLRGNNKKTNKLSLNKSNSRKVVKTIQIKTEESQPEIKTSAAFTSEASTLINDKPVLNNSNKTKGYVFKNHRSIKKKNSRKDKEMNQIKEIDVFNYKGSLTEYNDLIDGQPQSLPNNKLAYSIYFVLGKKHIESVEQMKNAILSSNSNHALVNERRQCSKQNAMTSYLSQHKKEEITPFVDPLPFLHNQQFENESQLNRYQRINNSLLNLRYKIKSNPEKQIPLLKEFLFTNGIYNKECFSKESLSKLSQFISSPFTIDPKKSLKMNLLKIIDSSRLKDKEATTITGKSLLKNKGGKSTNDIKENQKDSAHDIRLNMNLQKSLYENKVLRTDIDLENNPEPALEELQKELNHCYSNIPYKKGIGDNTFLAHYNDIRNTPHKLKQSYSKDHHRFDIEEIKKRNKLLEYICYEKALNYSNIKKCKKSLPFLKSIKIK